MSNAVERLRTILSEETGQDRLAEAALLLAQAHDPSVDVAAYLRQFSDWASYLSAQFDSESTDAADRIGLLNQFLFEELGFAGDGDNLFDPRNSFLDSVIDRRMGIPITLSVIYVELGRRIGLPLQGVSFPGHFLVMLPVSHGAVVLDPFSEGASLELADLEVLLRHADPDSSAEAGDIATLLKPATLSEVLVRMLRNLKGIYWRKRDLIEGLGIQDLLLAVDPELAVERRDRGILNQRLGHAHAALEDYSKYLSLEPDAVDAELIRDRMVELNKESPTLH